MTSGLLPCLPQQSIRATTKSGQKNRQIVSVSIRPAQPDLLQSLPSEHFSNRPSTPLAEALARHGSTVEELGSALSLHTLPRSAAPAGSFREDVPLLQRTRTFSTRLCSICWSTQSFCSGTGVKNSCIKLRRLASGGSWWHGPDGHEH